MRIGSGIILMAIGAILVWAVDAEVPYVSLDIIGYILIAAGVIGLIWALLASQRTRVTEARTVQDPNTGETVHRAESHDGL
ncbi:MULTISPECIES: DUF6458 family protein [unclassified Tessaracoccus]|uniref:DUF6458 family protein n=1 Tax=unclassified Tessaracoccus TaxID=2635419 RepID=UPI00096E65E7|nr:MULTISPECIES: DUF6458 family protein [unclassified Tessaracoccus]MBB1510398.1 hypothetical protein [Tessaracoccus sp. MC1756]MCG6567581.1 hypothetical protein [Tessaracoccus sp. ZS01]OMG55941.1 hypothetical protein BJN44_08100 [Tessaracoccus sp. ZS01]